MSTLWRKIQVPGNLNVYKFDKVYRKGTNISAETLKQLSLSDKLKAAVQSVTFLEVSIATNYGMGLEEAYHPNSTCRDPEGCSCRFIIELNYSRSVLGAQFRVVKMADGSVSAVRSRVTLRFKNVSATLEEFLQILNNHKSQLGAFKRCSLSDDKAILSVDNEEIANNYISWFNGYQLNGQQMKVSVVRKDKPLRDEYKCLTLTGLPKDSCEEDIKKGLAGRMEIKFKRLVADGAKWKLFFFTVSDCVKANAILNGAKLKLKDKTVAVKSSIAEFGTKTINSARVFVRNLPFKVTEQQLKKLFTQFDPKAKIHIPDGSKGYAFVQFANRNRSTTAISKLNGTAFHGRKLQLTHSLPMSLYSEKKEGIETSSLQEEDKGELPVEDEASNCVEPSVVPSVSAHAIDGHDASDEKDRTIFIRNLSYETTEDELREYFEKHGAVTTCKICKDEHGVSKTTAFILFKDKDTCDQVLEMERLALERDEYYSTGVEDRKVRQSSVAGLGFSLNGRRLKLSLAISRDEAAEISRLNRERKEQKISDKKQLHLLMKGVIDEHSAEFKSLNDKEQKLIKSALHEKLEKMKNPNMFINPKRKLRRKGILRLAADIPLSPQFYPSSGLCVRNLPPTVTSNDLRQNISCHFRECGLSDVLKTKNKGVVKVTLLSDESRKVKVGSEMIRRRKPFAFIEFTTHELALKALEFLANNSKLYGRLLLAEFAIEDSRALFIQKKRKEQYLKKLEKGQMQAKRKQRKYSRGQRQRMKRRKLRENNT